MPARRQLTPTGAERRAEIVQARTNRRPWHEIAAEHNISVTRAFQIHAEAIAATPSSAVKLHRAEIDLLADRAIGGLLSIAEDTSVAPATRVTAFQAIEKWVGRICRVHGGIEDMRIEAGDFLGRVNGQRIALPPGIPDD